MTRLLLVGWDAADWKVIEPLLARGEMANLARLVAGGVRGNLATIYPPLSPMVWTSIATGKRPTKHGILGFTEPTEDGLAVRPVSNLGRKTKAIWNILNQAGKRSLVVSWWPSHPAEHIRGAMVSNHFPLATGNNPSEPMLPRTVWPPSWAEPLSELRVHGIEVTGEILRLFVPELEKVNQEKDKSLHDLAGIIAETMSIHGAATELMSHEPWDLCAIYYSGIDHFSHRFMRYHARKTRARDGSDPALFRGIVANAYRYHDAMLGRLLALAGPDCAVMLVSDHGFHSDRMLPDYIPAEAAGPAVEHRDFGVFCLSGPGVLRGQRIYGASVLDIAPTVLHVFGLPAARDMDGKVLINAFEQRALPAAIPSWDEVAGEDGRHPPEQQYDGLASVEALKQLVALGYVAPPGEDTGKAVKDCVIESRYNLARAEMDAGRSDRAAELLRELIAEDPEQVRYQQHLFHCLLQQNDLEGCARMLDSFDEVCAALAERCLGELRRRRAERSDQALADERGSPDRRELFERRQLAEKANGFAAERLLMRSRLALAELDKPGRTEAARSLLEKLASKAVLRRQLGLFFAEGFALLGEHERALEFTARVRRADRENWRAMAWEARIHHAAGQHAEAVAAAIDSLSLVYFQPLIHHLLGVSLRHLGDDERAEQAFNVAISQAPGLAAARDQLVELMRKQGRLGEAGLHMAHAEMIRKNAGERRQKAQAPARVATGSMVAPAFSERSVGAAPACRSRTVTVVTGLPRTGTSMMMQMLAAGGIEPYSDGKRPSDEDNPRGYFEHEQATQLAHDRSWLPAARGKAVKIVAPLLPFLPRGEEYRLVFMHRDLDEVIASQTAMLSRLKRQGGRLDDRALKRAYTGQLVRVRDWLDRHREIPVLVIHYAEVLRDPNRTVSRLRAFLGDPFCETAAAASVDTSLRRQFQSATGKINF